MSILSVLASTSIILASGDMHEDNRTVLKGVRGVSTRRPDPPRPKTVKPPGAATYAIRRKRCPVCYALPGKLCILAGEGLFGKFAAKLIEGSETHLARLDGPKG